MIFKITTNLHRELELIFNTTTEFHRNLVLGNLTLEEIYLVNMQVTVRLPRPATLSLSSGRLFMVNFQRQILNLSN